MAVEINKQGCGHLEQNGRGWTQKRNKPWWVISTVLANQVKNHTKMDLITAAENGDLSAVKAAIKRGEDVNSVDKVS